MARGKYKLKKERARQAGAEKATPTVVEEKKETNENRQPVRAKEERKAVQRAASSPWWHRFLTYLFTSSSFTDWCIAAFTLALTLVGYQQYKILDGQLQVMRIEQRAWMSIMPDLAHSTYLPLP